MFGSLSPLSITTDKPLVAEPRLIATIATGYDTARRACCLNEEQIWTRGDNNILKLLSLTGKLLASIQVREHPYDIAVTRDGNLIYADLMNETVNIVKNKQMQILIKLWGWSPRNVCSTSSDDLLVAMVDKNETKSKIVRYSGSTVKQTIQFDDQGRPLFSSESHSKYISENKNLDICVADKIAKAVVVLKQSGKLRFKYTGIPSNAMKSFDPTGIATNSQSHILIADSDNHIIHILDQKGQFLQYIQGYGLNHPNGLCVDIRDNLFVTEIYSAKVKKIQYL
jgi:DNA-binding beta-propeller fold protein YncE